MNNNTEPGKQKLYEQVENNGIPTFKFESWNNFFVYINNQMGKYDADFIWRGQADSSWEIVSSLKRCNSDGFHHLLNFKNAILGLTNTTFHIADSNNAEEERLKLWALGQHFGLATPLIDWTQFPFVALFFAFHEEENQVSPQAYRAVYAISMSLLRAKNYDIINNGDMGMDNFFKNIQNPPYSEKFVEELINTFDGNFSIEQKEQLRKTKTLPKIAIEQLTTWQNTSLKEQKLRLYFPDSNENYRVYSQGGLFCYTPSDISVEDWVRKNSKRELDKHILRKYLIPNNDRKAILKALNKMRINYLSLFADFRGAAQYCNMALKERETTLSSIRPY